MMRDRLTTDKRKIFARECPTLMSITKDELRMLYNVIFDRLQEYEVAEETGQIIVPPCKVGAKVYQICFGKLSEQKIIKKSKVTAIKITDKLTITLDYTTNLYDTDIGYWLFVGENAKEEAEQALSKLQASYEQVKEGAK